MSEALKDAGYAFNSEGQLRRISDGAAYVFDVHDGDANKNQRSYERVAEAIVQYLADVMREKHDLLQVRVPLGAAETEPHCVIYHSPDVFTNENKLMLLIQGSGAVRPGMWSRSAIINEGLRTGSVLPYIEKAKALGYAVVVLNPNDNEFEDADGDVHRIPGSERPEAHVAYIWDKKSAAKRVDIVAHSYGGVSTCALHKNFPDEVEERVVKIAFTDAVHSVGSLPERSRKFIAEHAINWVRSPKPLDTFVEAPRDRGSGCLCVSAGHAQHEYTSGYCITSLFAWLNDEKQYEMPAADTRPPSPPPAATRKRSRADEI